MEAVQKKKQNREMLLLAAWAFVLTVKCWVGIVNCLNTTVLAFHYGYGYISRGVMGTVLRFIDAIVPYDMLTYQGIVYFSMAQDTLWLILLFVFFHYVLRHSRPQDNHRLMAILFVFSTFAFPEYLTEQNFGRSDLILACIALIEVLLIMHKKHEWLILPLSALAVSVHQGYVLMFFNVTLVLLWCRIFDTQGRQRKKYLIIFLSSLLLASVLFLYLNFFSHSNGQAIYRQIWKDAASYAHDGVVQYNVIYHEILGISPAADEWKDHIHNFEELPVFLVLMLPYLIIAFRFFRDVMRSAVGREKWKYLAVAVGAATILPDMIVKIDYGRWIFAVIFYYFVTVAALAAMRDRRILQQLEIAAGRIGQCRPAAVMLAAYPILFVPLTDVYICAFTNKITNWIIGLF